MMISVVVDELGARSSLVVGFLVTLVAAGLLLTAKPAYANTFTVNTTSDFGDGACSVSECTLREAIDAANDRMGADTINFNISGDGPHTIAPSSGLPNITDPMTIDGYSQPGSKPNTLATGNNAVLKIELSGANAGSNQLGLTINTANSRVKGLVINRWGGAGWGWGVSVYGSGADSNLVQGNFIGTDVSGTQDLGNSSSGVNVIFGSNNTIGGTTAAVRNLISGNDDDGVSISAGQGNKVQGNYIGTEANGPKALGNSGDGVVIFDAPNTTVGGTTAAARNVISGNSERGVAIFGINGSGAGNKVQGNYIGTDPWGTGGGNLGNRSNGVLINNASNTAVGGMLAGARNVISNNGGHGVIIFAPEAKGNRVQGNRIGTGPWGNVDIGNSFDGVVIWDAPDNTIGGTETGARNVISGNNENGIHIFGAGAKGNKVEGNYIGTDASGKQDLGNSSDGVFIEDMSTNNIVGGTLAGARNVISGNDRNGVYIYGFGATGNSILSNSIHSNGSLAIDLTRDSFPPVPDGVTGNDVDDADTGPNNLQNYPVVDSATASSRRITIKGSLISIPNRTFTIQFFSNPSGTDEGQKLVGQKVVTTDANGDANFSFSKRQRVPVEREITATATIHDSTDTSKPVETSEFSAPMSVVHPD